ncbi:MAG: type II secretion system F family protein [Magnetococcales bacterium]|nr:type II secretion system F family protein [Magnetococcales bacterium]
MAKFYYKGRLAGKRVEGVLEGVDRDQVAAQLKKRRVVPLTITEKPTPQGGGQPRLVFFGRPKVEDMLLFARQMAALSRSGVPMVRAFEGLIESTLNRVLKQAMVRILADLQAGRDLSVALGEHPHLFDPFFLRMVRVGEETGRLGDAFQQIFSYLENDKETRRRLASAVRYPAFVVMTVFLALGVVNTYVIPAFVELFDKFGAELPFSTSLLLAASRFIQGWGWPVLFFLLLIIVLQQLSLRTDWGRLFWDRLVLTLPLVGSLLHRIILARLCRVFVLGSRSGMSMVQVLSTVADSADNRFIAGQIDGIRQGVSRGESLKQAVEVSGVFTPLVVQMIAVGEETGQVEQMMMEVAVYYEQEVDYEIHALSATLEPILLLCLAGIVLILALGIFLPLWELGSGGISR